MRKRFFNDRVLKGCTAVALIAAWCACPATLLAGSMSSQLTIGVIVIRSCSVDAQPAGQQSSRVRLACASGASRGLSFNGVSRIAALARNTDVVTPTTAFSPAAVQSDLRVVTVNF